MRNCLQVRKKLDREQISSYSLTILATDGLHSNTTILQVDVGDVNDNAPVCQQVSKTNSFGVKINDPC